MSANSEKDGKHTGTADFLIDDCFKKGKKTSSCVENIDHDWKHDVDFADRASFAYSQGQQNVTSDHLRWKY
jgi:hypothetical protein